MVRTAAGGIRISAGKSSKKVGGGAPSSSAGSSAKAASTSSKLPPIPFQETPSWQKPITNFFKTSPLKAKENKFDNEEGKNVIDNHNAEPSKKKLRLDSAESEEIDRDEETNGVVQEMEENQNEKPSSKDNKENAVKKVQEFDEGAGSSKD